MSARATMCVGVATSNSILVVQFANEEREEDFIDLDEDFHLRIATGAELPLLEGMLRQLREFVRVSRLGATRPPEA